MSRQDQVCGRAIAPVIEQLEGRQMLSANLSRGVLTVEGTGASDNIVVQLSKDNSTVEVYINDEMSGFASRKVTKLVVFGLKGNDSIWINEYTGPKFTTDAFLYGGRGADTITGGSGDDWVLGHKGNDDLAGGEGNNHIYGGIGDDVIEGVKESDSEAAANAESGKSPQSVKSPQAVIIPSYIVRDLGLLPNGIGNRVPTNINQAGEVVGWNEVDDDPNDSNNNQNLPPHAWVRTPAVPRMVDLGTMSNIIGSTSRAWDINNPGQIIGQSQISAGAVQQGFLWDNGIMSDVGFLASGGGRQNTAIYGINDPSLFIFNNILWAGPEQVGESAGQAIYIPEAGAPIFTLGQAGVPGRAREVNNAGFVVGHNSQTGHAFRNFRGTAAYVDLGVLPGTTTSEAYDINDDAQATIVGVANQGSVTTMGAFKWRQGLMTRLSTPVGRTSIALGVAPHTVAPEPGPKIVGGVFQLVNNQLIRHAALWLPTTTSAAGQLVDLATLTGTGNGRILELAHAINDTGQIVVEGRVGASGGGGGTGGNTQNVLHSFLLTPGNPTKIGQVIRFSANFIKPINSAVPNLPTTFDPRLVFNLFGGVDFKVRPALVNLDFQTIDVERNKLPSQGIADWVFTSPARRYVTSTTDGTGKFSGRADVFVTLEDGTIGNFLVKVDGRSFRKNKKDFIEGTFYAISSRGRVLKQGNINVFEGKFFPA